MLVAMLVALLVACALLVALLVGVGPASCPASCHASCTSSCGLCVRQGRHTNTEEAADQNTTNEGKTTLSSWNCHCVCVVFSKQIASCLINI